MVERVLSKRRRVMRNFVIKEISAVDRPAQQHARMTLMKRDDLDDVIEVEKDYGDMTRPAAISQEVQAVDFDTVLAECDAREAAQEIGDDLRAKWCALQRAFATIAADGSVPAPDKITAMQDSLQQFIDSLSQQDDDIVESVTKSLSAVPAIAELLEKYTNENEGDDPMTDVEKKQLADLQKSVDGLTKQLEAATAKEPAKKAADLQGELDDATAKLAKANEKISSAKELVGKAKEEYEEAFTKAAMSDAEKAHLATLDGADKMKFMQASPEERKKMLSKAADSDPVVYKSASTGEEFRKSDDPRLVKMAKAADDDRKIAKEEREKRENAEFAKRADDDLKFFSEDVAKRDEKIEVLRAVEKMPDGPKAALLKMLAVGGKAISAAFTTIGHSNEAVAKTGRDFEKRVTEIMARDKIGKLDALDKAARECPDEYAAYQATGVQIN